MSATLRKVLFWLLVLALPLHGVAGATMVPSHSTGHAPISMQEGSQQGAMPGMAGTGMATQSMQDCADRMADCGQLFGVVKCHLSSPCGLVAVPALHVAPFADAAAASLPVLVPLHVRVVFCTGAPERPPRPRA